MMMSLDDGDSGRMCGPAHAGHGEPASGHERDFTIFKNKRSIDIPDRLKYKVYKRRHLSP
jgi:hypothetical protein